MSLLDTFEKNVKEAPFLQFVGYMLTFGGLIGIALEACKPVHKFPFVVAFTGLGVSMAGYLYKKIYP